MPKRFICRLCETFNFWFNFFSISTFRGGIHIHIVRQNVILMFFSQPTNPPLKTSNVEHTKLIRNTNLLLFGVKLKMLCYTIGLIIKHLSLNIMIQGQSSIKTKNTAEEILQWDREKKLVSSRCILQKFLANLLTQWKLTSAWVFHIANERDTGFVLWTGCKLFHKVSYGTAINIRLCFITFF